MNTRSPAGWILLSTLVLASGPTAALAQPRTDTPLARLAASIAPGDWAELDIDGSVSTCDALVPPSGNGNILEYTDEARWNPVSHTVYVMGTARPYAADDQQFVIYSEDTNSWTIKPRPPFNPGFHGYDHAAIDTVTGEFFWAMTGTPSDVRRLDPTATTWSDMPNLPAEYTPQTVGLDYFPERGELIYVNNVYGEPDGGEVWAYHASAGEWERLVSGLLLAEMQFFSEPIPTRGIFVFGGGWDRDFTEEDEGYVWYSFDAAGTVTRMPDSPTVLGHWGSGPVQTVDPVTGKLLVFVAGGPYGECEPNRSYEFDFETNTWSGLPEHPLREGAECPTYAAATPIPEYGVVFVADFNPGACHVWLYRHSEGLGTPLPGRDGGVGGEVDAGGMPLSDGGTAIPGSDGGAPRGDARPPGDGGAMDATGGCQCAAAPAAPRARFAWIWALAVGATAYARRHRPRRV